jgi:uncharacterized membrane protein
MPSSNENSPNDERKTAVTGWQRSLVIFLQKSVYWLTKFWYPLFMAAISLFLLLGFLAPALQAEGNEEAATAVYRFLAVNNHQLPERSYFLFGANGPLQAYSLAEILAFGADSANLQAFKGNAEIGYKTGLNHRMIAIFIGMIVAGLIWGIRKGRPRLSIVQFALLTLPLLLDGFSHIVSESGSSFRDSNDWLVMLSGDMFTAVFYTGTIPGSFNWWLRTLTGLLFGLGLVWFLFPRFADYFKKRRNELEPRLKRIGAI